MFFHMYIALGQGQTTHCGQNPDVKRKALSLCLFVTNFKKISFKSDFIHNFLCFYTWGLNSYIHINRLSLWLFAVSFFHSMTF